MIYAIRRFHWRFWRPLRAVGGRVWFGRYYETRIGPVTPGSPHTLEQGRRKIAARWAREVKRAELEEQIQRVRISHHILPDPQSIPYARGRCSDLDFDIVIPGKPGVRVPGPSLEK